jgi:hypothetical protein
MFSGGFIHSTNMYIDYAVQTNIRDVVRLDYLRSCLVMVDGAYREAQILSKHSRQCVPNSLVDVITSGGVITCSSDQPFLVHGRGRTQALNLVKNNRLVTPDEVNTVNGQQNVLVRGVKKSSMNRRVTLFSIVSGYRHFALYLPGCNNAIIVPDAEE